MSISTLPKVVLCTGANRGLGFQILHVGGLRKPSDHYVLACREVSSGNQALGELRKLGVKSEIEVLQLDVTNDSHIIKAVEHVKTKHGRLDVLINNAGSLTLPGPDDTLTGFRQGINNLLNNNLTSTAVVTKAFQPLLSISTDPKVINITSGLASMKRLQARSTAGDYSQYITTKSGMNGMTVHAQIAENGRVAAMKEQGKVLEGGRIRYYLVAPGFLKTDFTGNHPAGKDPELGAEVVVRLVVDDKNTYEGGQYWEFDEGEMRIVPW